MHRTALPIALLAALAAAAPAPVAAAITVGDYLDLRQAAGAGDRAAEQRRRLYVIGVMDGIQAVQAPARAGGGRLHFCMDDKFPLSPAFLDQLIEEAIATLTRRSLIEQRRQQPMAVLIALELEHRFPCQ